MNPTETEKLRQMLDGTIAADPEWLTLMAQKYPFFPIAEAMAIRTKAGEGSSALPTPDQLADLRIMLADPEAAERLAAPAGTEADFANFYPAQSAAPTPTTVNAIDKFLATYGDIDQAETSTLEKLIFNPVADYSQQLARQEEESLPDAAPTGDSQADRINRFILSVRSTDGSDTPAAPSTPSAPEPSPQVTDTVSTPVNTPAPEHPKPKAATPPENSLLSESLAKIYIKTHRYERAYEILSRLSLAFPEKNAYFADQLRFLRKLILAERFRQKRIDTQNPTLSTQS